MPKWILVTSGFNLLKTSAKTILHLGSKIDVYNYKLITTNKKFDTNVEIFFNDFKKITWKMILNINSTKYKPKKPHSTLTNIKKS